MKNKKTFVAIALLLTFGGLFCISAMIPTVGPINIVSLSYLFILGICFLWIGRKQQEQDRDLKEDLTLQDDEFEIIKIEYQTVDKREST